MADERDAWLDQDAAERLLRGEPVETAGIRTGAQAERLARALREAAGRTYPGGPELPGEAAALAAFRQARAAAPAGSGPAGRSPRNTAATDGAAASGGSGSIVATVRLARSTGAARAPGPGRFLRWGLNAVVAGCALCGLAVAMGTAVVLPTPFADEATPLPARSVTGAKSPDPSPSGPDAGPDSGQNGVLPAPGVTGVHELPAAPAPSPARRGPEPGSASPEAAGTGTGPGNAGTDNAGTDIADGWDGQTEAAGKHGRAWRKQYRITVKDCRDYRDGDIAPNREDALDAARGGLDIEDFCDRLLDGKGGHTGDHRGDSRGPGEQGNDAGLGEAGTGDPGQDPQSDAPSPGVTWSPMILPPAGKAFPAPAVTGEQPPARPSPAPSPRV